LVDFVVPRSVPVFPVQVNGISVSCVDGSCCIELATTRSAPGPRAGCKRFLYSVAHHAWLGLLGYGQNSSTGRDYWVRSER
jgi:hypothetical protein